MPRRFFLPQPLDGPQFVLTGPEAHHLVTVLRCRVGDEVVLFDGTGDEVRARIASVASGSVHLQIVSVGPAQTETPVPITLATAVPKGERFDWLIEKATELGIHRLVPLITERSVVRPGPGKLDRLRRTVVAASKQSGRSRLMEISGLMSWSEFLEREARGNTVYIADGSGEPAGIFEGGTGSSIVAAVGPEGGFTTDELAAAVGVGCRIISLGPRILRVETAALALAVLLSNRVN